MGIIQLADVPKCSCEVSMFYHRYREPISRIRTIEQRIICFLSCRKILKDTSEHIRRNGTNIQKRINY